MQRREPLRARRRTAHQKAATERLREFRDLAACGLPRCSDLRDCRFGFSELARIQGQMSYCDHAFGRAYNSEGRERLRRCTGFLTDNQR
jgi:hypothetical protein